MAVQVTLVQPNGKRLPEGGPQVIVGAGSQLSLAVTTYSTLAPIGRAQRISMLLGQLITGGKRSGLTVTSKQHQSGRIPVGALLQLTVVVPSGKMLPAGTEHTIGKMPPVQTLVM